MISFLIGAVTISGLFLTIEYARRNGIRVSIIQWIVTALAFAYLAFVLQTIASFIQEMAYRAALIMGLFLGFFAIVWFVLIFRFIFRKRSKEN